MGVTGAARLAAPGFVTLRRAVPGGGALPLLACGQFTPGYLPRVKGEVVGQPTRQVSICYPFSMQEDFLSAFVMFALVASATPGPNNMMVMASGAHFGIARTLPHVFGIAFGFALMLFLVGAGMMQVFAALPGLHGVLRVVSVAWLLWLAWKIATAGRPGGKGVAGRPLGFVQAAAFQWVNPKAWSIATSAIVAFVPDGAMSGIVTATLVFAAMSPFVTGAWALAGSLIGGALATPGRLVLFNYTMAGLLVLSLLVTLRG